ncbi:hypothetical protein [Mycoplasmopsis gallinarum]|uniref:Putative spermidine/putrescine substrate binding protein n=1 Tax=Mycoplasmopsis gallinarum TaxID=29557 RepID=A0A168RBY2_9BACT|nr:hypothetical protein [Mycoplasmopsis gallinarum]OAB48820.1 putative spermidine/putrescine substrate binding protein [Mycoplasmopsis gallinarum]
MSFFKIKHFLKTKIFTKTSGLILFGAGIAGVLTSALIYKSTKKFKPSFYNFKNYISEKNWAIISENFDYKEFDTVNQFTNAVLTRKAATGIGNDFLSVDLIKQNKLIPLDFQKIFNFSDEDVKTKRNLANKLKTIYTEQMWEHLSSYDVSLNENTDEANFETNKHLWEYFVPYFSQDMIVVYNPSKILGTDDYEKYYEFDRALVAKLTQEDSDDKAWTANKITDYDALKTVKESGFNVWEITDAVRDNMIYGSSFYYDKNTASYTDAYTTGKVANPEGKLIYKDLIDKFGDMIQKSLNYSLTNANLNFNGDGLELVDWISNPEKPINAGIIYNGDAYDAFFSEDNHEQVRPGTIRYIKPKNNILLVDGLVIANDTTKEYIDIIYDTLRRTFLEGITDQNGDLLDLNTVENVDELGSVDNFYSVGYVPAYRNVYQYIKDHHFDEQFNEEFRNRMKKRYPNISEARWNEIFEYEINYAKNLYEITSEYTPLIPGTNQKLLSVNDGKYFVQHHKVEPVNQKEITEIETYWNLKIRK